MAMVKYTPKRGRPPIHPDVNGRAKHLIQANPTLHMTDVAHHVGVSPATVSKWFEEWGLKRWNS